jgi:hypothetical protein
MIIVKLHLKKVLFLLSFTKDKSHPLSIFRGRGVFRDVFRDTTAFAEVWIRQTTSLAFRKIWIPSIVSRLSLPLQFGDASLDIIGYVTIEACPTKLKDIRLESGSQTCLI